MQASSAAPWRWPPATRSSTPTNPYLAGIPGGIHHTMSMSNIQGAAWQWPRMPPSPTLTATSSSSTGSRSTTPTNGWNLSAKASPPPSYASRSTTPKNPWSSYVSLSTPSSPGDSQETASSLDSRSGTPVASPVRYSYGGPPPFERSVTFPYKEQGNPRFSPRSGNSPPRGSPRGSPPRNGILEDLQPAGAPPSDAFPFHLLENVIITPPLLLKLQNAFPSLLSRQGWDRTKNQMAYGWALKNPKTALLFWMCDDIAAWPRAVIFGLEDRNLPFQEAALAGIMNNPAKAVDLQWRVMLKELPQNGQHTDFHSNEAVPLRHVGTIAPSESIRTSVDKVCWLTDSSERVYYRKRITCRRPAQKLTLQKQVLALKNVRHRHIADITCSYSHGNDFTFITPFAEQNIDDYLSQEGGNPRQPHLLLRWINDLAQALSFVHSATMSHKSIRPEKILISGNRVYFAAFGVTLAQRDSVDLHSHHLATIPSAEHSSGKYVYAAPEQIAGTQKFSTRAADVFSLGCVFLTMVASVRGISPVEWSAYRAADTGDPSFHANLNVVHSWCTKQLQGARGRGVIEPDVLALQFARHMLTHDPNRRVKMEALAPHVAKWSESIPLDTEAAF